MSFYKFSEALMKKYIHFTIIYRYDHSTADIAVIADEILDQFRKDTPGVTDQYTNSENVGFYHGNYSLEAVYILCRQKGFRLLSYYNEPCCDQWERITKTVKVLGLRALSDVS